MRVNPTLFQVLVAAIVLCTATSGHAGITKCVDREGRVSYSSEGAGACGAHDSVSQLESAVVNQPMAEAMPRIPSRTALENTVLRESVWAQPPATMHRARTDAATVRQARNSSQAIDRALASLRTQKVASAR